MKRLSDESVKEFWVRLCENKDTQNLTWTEITEIMNGETGDSFSESVYRKKWYAFKDGMEFAAIKSVNNKDFTYEIEKKKLELQKERVKLSSLRSDLNKHVRESARAELIFEEMLNSLDRVEVPEFKPLKMQRADREYLLCFSDAHFGKEFESTNNKFDTSILYQRFNKMLAEVLDIIEDEGVQKLHILNLADSVEGMCLRISQLNSLQIGMTDQVIGFCRFMVNWLNTLSKFVEIVYHHVPASNHTQIRPLGTNANQFVKEDVERIIQMYVHDMLENNSRITVPIYDNDYVRLQICGRPIIAKHGQDIKNVRNAIKDLSMLHGEFYQYAIFGHKHHANSMTVGENDNGNCDVIYVPSMMGSDEYSDALKTGAKAGATFMVFDERQGKKITYDIVLN